MSDYELLFSPIRLGNMELANRLVMSPMQTCYAGPGGSMSQQLLAYYQARSRGGVGCVIVEATAVSANGRNEERGLCLYDDQHQEDLKVLIDAIHEGGAKAAIQLNHSGLKAPSELIGGQPVEPSSSGEATRELNAEEIQALVKDFAAAAERARTAGADAVELHGAHGNLICQFLSPATNKRSDEYGGDTNKRARFLTDIIASAKENLGEDFPVFVRFSVEEEMKGGLTVAESLSIAQLAEKAGASALHVSTGSSDVSAKAAPTAEAGRGTLLAHVAQIKAGVSIPVIAAGRILDADMAEQILKDGKADLIAMGRALIADPELPSKVKSGRQDDILPCIGCNLGCVDRRFSPENHLHCLTNPFTGREAELSGAVKAVAEPKTVVVIGGGVAGMQAAYLLAMRGHRVTLLEKESYLGGQFLCAALPAGKADFADFVHYLTRQLEKHKVTVELSHSATVESVASFRPDAVLVATGSTGQAPEVPGTEHPLVAYAMDLLSGRVKAKQNVVIVGGNSVGVQLADMLAQTGKYVKIVEERDEVAYDMVVGSWDFYRPRLAERKVEFLTGAKLKRIRSTNVFFEKEGHTVQLDVDMVVFADNRRSNDDLVARLQEHVDRVYVLGDAKEPRTAVQAVFEAMQVGMRV